MGKISFLGLFFLLFLHLSLCEGRRDSKTVGNNINDIQNSIYRNHKSHKIPDKNERTPKKIRIIKEKGIAKDFANNVVVFSEETDEMDYLYDDEFVRDKVRDRRVDPKKLITMVYEILLEKSKKLDERVETLESEMSKIKNKLTYIDCYDVKMENPEAKSGIYEFHLDTRGNRIISVHCDMETRGGGWTVIQQRLPRNHNDTENYPDFVRNYKDYKTGFGSADSDYWLGLENIFTLTNARQYELRIDLMDFANKTAYASYAVFYIDNERKGFKLHATGYSGNAGDSISTDNGWDNFTADGMLFSTWDKDLDTSEEINCSAYWNIGGWWFNRCSWANLNGPYKFPAEKKQDEEKFRRRKNKYNGKRSEQRQGKQIGETLERRRKDNEESCVGINWHKWRNKECLSATRMMIRPLERDYLIY